MTIDGARQRVEAEAAIDDSAGYHPRHTLWCWSAGVGRAVGAERVGWDQRDPENSERTIWVDDRPSEVVPASFDEDLHRIRFAGGGELRFRPWPRSPTARGSVSCAATTASRSASSEASTLTWAASHSVTQ